MILDCITVWQPWASLIAIRAKPYEFRGWVPPKAMIGRRIAIHAGARPVRKAEVSDLLERLQGRGDGPPPCLYAAIAEPFLRQVLAGLDAKDLPIFGEPAFRLPLSSVVCTGILGRPKRGDDCAREFGFDAANDRDRDGAFNWGWPLTAIEEVLPPSPARGAQGFWKWTEA
ncbi:hypothetical protein ABE438_17665 [Bosea sp. TWI1241]|uniref:hypothetical protein n=1 Tax=Bosea sp. TWI1241 TaxID=3148904 RepID=UPI00320BA6A1